MTSTSNQPRLIRKAANATTHYILTWETHLHGTKESGKPFVGSIRNMATARDCINSRRLERGDTTVLTRYELLLEFIQMHDAAVLPQRVA